ncbi:MAG: hypothetical protein WBG13_30960 [Pseudolabrys sp.]
MTILDAQHDLPAFRLAIRDWLAEVVPPDWKARMVRASMKSMSPSNAGGWWNGARSVSPFRTGRRSMAAPG